MSKNVDPDFTAIIDAAIKAMPNAYAPYSQFHVGAAIQDETGRIHTGVNVENAAYPQGSCAEAGAIAAMVMAGGQQIKGIAVAGGGEALCTPCGGCRQRIREFASPETPVLICGPYGLRGQFSLNELLPHNFGPDNLDG